MPHTYEQIASDWNLWIEFADPDATTSREEFDSMSIDKKIAIQVEAFGPEPEALNEQN